MLEQVVAQIGERVVESFEISSPQPSEEVLIRNRTRIKRAVAVKREWEAGTAKATERVASLLSECTTMKLMSMKINKTAAYKQLVRLVNSFSFGLEEAGENLELLRILGVLCRLGADGISKNAVIAALNDNAPEISLPRAVEMSRSSE
ncbi:hypothetical protein AXG93_1671s1010 [Marchantia polymorpha subsp. ruderalis]|uniref:Uncharacterized protein n=1 Tax=Marchantia polymorpha subsp. ruderalis TaxID=1480154 RepID=A0A176WLP0_MARPO|nr:hypothetical protein AXG93_1671s1010 [Marchantia polymorpha subsp. ruderalis]